MPLPVITNVFRVALEWGGGIAGGSNPVNVMHFLDSLGGQDENALNTALNAHWSSTQQTCTATALAATTMVITALNGTSGSQTYVSANARWVGETGGQYIPASSSLIKLTTPLRGRSHRGRLFLPGLGEAAQDGGIVSAGLVTACNTAWASFLTAMNTANWPMQVASYKLATSATVTHAVCQSMAATQRRRQRK